MTRGELNSQRRPTLISLFAGAGGLDLGLEEAGFRTLAVNELEPHACATLRFNKELADLDAAAFDVWLDGRIASQRCYVGAPEWQLSALRARIRAGLGERWLQDAAVIEGDIRAVSTEELLEAAGAARGEVDVVAGGPPCQPFSRSGKRQTVATAEGRLFVEFVRVVDEARPRWFIFENVKGLSQSKTSVWQRCCATCGHSEYPPFTHDRIEPIHGSPAGPCGCGAELRWHVDLAVRGGSLELILEEFERIGYSCDWRLLNAASFGLPQSRERLFIVGSRDHESFTWPRPSHARSAEDGRPQLFNTHVTLPEETMWSALWRDGHPLYGELDDELARLWVKNVVRPHDEPVTWTLHRPAPTVGAHQAAKLALAPYGVPPAQLARQQWHTLGRRQGDSPPVPVEHAYLTDEELLVLQGFPRSWYLHGTRMQRAFQIGNAVPPLLARAVGEAIITCVGRAAPATTSEELAEAAAS